MTPSPWPRRTSRRTPGSSAGAGPLCSGRGEGSRARPGEQSRCLSSVPSAARLGPVRSVPEPVPVGLPPGPGARPLRPADPPVACCCGRAPFASVPSRLVEAPAVAYLCACGFVPLLRLSAPLPGCPRDCMSSVASSVRALHRLTRLGARHPRAPREQRPRSSAPKDRRGLGRRPKRKMERLLPGAANLPSDEMRDPLLPPCPCV